jgi:hypothetical protein
LPSFLLPTPYGKPPNEKPKRFVSGSGDVAGVLAGVLPLSPIAAAKGLKADDVSEVSSPYSREKPPKPPNGLVDVGEVAPPVSNVKKLEVESVGLVLLPAPKPPKVGAEGEEPEPDGTREKVGAGFGAVGTPI